jgi:hypothetical protein
VSLPRRAGGIGIVASTLQACWTQVDEGRLRRYVVRTGNSAVARRRRARMTRRPRVYQIASTAARISGISAALTRVVPVVSAGTA